jgi:hypothetical protein
MRPQQKSFVVEIKSKGRLSTVRQGSIWGTTDLKALAQQAASVAPQLFDMTVDVTEAMMVNAPQSLDTVAPVPVDLTAAVQSERSDEIETISGAAVEPETALMETVALSLPTDAGQTRRPDAPRRARKSSSVKKVAVKADTSQALNASDTSSDSELIRLEAENVRLKSLWADRLREQNSVLRAKLERFLSA